MNKMINPQGYQKKGFDDRIVKYDEIHKVKEKDYKALIKAIDPREGDIIFEGCAGYADVSKHILDATKKFKKRLEIYIQDESLVQMNRAQKAIKLPKDHMILGDIRKTGMADNKFDKVVIKMSVHELPKREQPKIFSEMYRILKPGGKFIVWELSLNKDTQKIFNKIIRKKDKLAGFNAMVKNRYFPKHEELQKLFKKTGFKSIKDDYKIRYTFNPRGRFEEFISKDRLQMLDSKKVLSQKDKQELNHRAEARVLELIKYMRKVISEKAKAKVAYKDFGDDIKITIDKIIMSGKK